MDGQSWHCGACGGENPAGFRFCGHCGTLAVAADDRPTERRLVTALFADVSGFTTLADRLDSDDLHEIIAPLIRGLAEIAERYGGTVAKYAGDALLVFFGAPIAREDDPARALQVALEMHARLPELLRELPTVAAGLELHIGVNTGHVVSDRFGGDVRADYSILGDAVNVAQRLESVAPAGETYVGATTYDATSVGFRFERVGDLALKGKPVPVTAWRLIGHRGLRQVVPATRATEHAGTVLGRARELATLDRVLEDTHRGTGAVVTVTGEPGIGKTTLLAGAHRAAVRRGYRWLQTRCLSYGAGVAYWPFTQLLREHLRDAHPHVELSDALTRALPAGAVTEVGALARLLDVPGPDVGALSADAFRERVQSAFVLWLTELCREAPVTLAIEDIQWGDPSSLQLARAITTAGAKLPLVVAFTSRDGVTPISVTPERSVDITLGPLDESGTASLVASVLADRPPPALVELTVERSAGNPLFAREIVRSLQDTGALRHDGRGWVLREGWDPSAVPATIERVISSRIDGLPQGAVRVLTSASVIGRSVPLPILRDVIDDPSTFAPGVTRLVDAGLLERVAGDDERLFFSHALVQDVAYGRLLRRQRRQLHARVADACETRYGDGDDVIELLATHRYLGGGGARAISCLIRAGERSRRLYALEEAAVHFERAVEVARSDAIFTNRLPACVLQLATTEETLGRYDDALTHYGEVRGLTSDAAAWRGLASTSRRKGDYHGALAVLDEAEAMALVGDDHDLVALRLERGWTLSLLGDAPASVAALRSGLAQAAGRADAVTGHLLGQLARAESLTGDYEAAVEHAHAARRTFEAIGDQPGLASALRILGGVHLDHAEYDTAGTWLRAALDIATRTGTVEEVAGTLLNLGMVELRRGALDEAIACDERAIELFDGIDHGSGRAVGYANLAEKLLVAGDLEAARSWCDRALAEAERIDHALTIADALQTSARILTSMGDHLAAAEAARRAAVRFEALGLADDVEICADLLREAERSVG